jgi:hypothetical protein
MHTKALFFPVQMPERTSLCGHEYVDSLYEALYTGDVRLNLLVYEIKHGIGSSLGALGCG